MQIYQLKFPNGKSYIGITSKTAQERFARHCNPAVQQRLCQKAIHKYGKENVALTVLATVDNWELLCLAEIEAIEKFNTFYPNGYNMTLGGEGTYGVSASNETRKKMSLCAQNKTIEHREKISVGNKGKKRSIESIDKQKQYLKTNNHLVKYHQDKKQEKIDSLKRESAEKTMIRLKRILREISETF